MTPIATGLLLAGMAWFSMWVTPLVDTTGFNQMLGLEQHEATLVAIVFLVGLLIGQVQEQLSKFAAAHNKLLDRIEELEGRLARRSLGLDQF